MYKSSRSISASFHIGKLLKRAGIILEDMDLIEISKTFAMTVVVNIGLMNVNLPKANVKRGVISFEHPISMNEAQFLITVLKQNKGKYHIT
jgi:acetyl-CoA acetyltransferase